MRIDDGPWLDWRTDPPSATIEVTGVAGQRLAFRSRAVDLHYNVEPWPTTADAETTIESWPPRTSMSRFFPYTRTSGPLFVAWGGIDPGGSGILSYDVQYRIAGGTWVDWQTDTTLTSAIFGPRPFGLGVPVSFRVRARDRATNLQPWSSLDLATTVAYRWAVTGQITDNVGTPLAQIDSHSNRPTFGQLSTNRDGQYRILSDATTTDSTISWAKSPYGTLPQTTFVTSMDQRADLVLPPQDNLLSGGQFEQDWPDPAWSVSGSLPVDTAMTGRSSGRLGLQFGQPGHDLDSESSPTVEDLPRLNHLFVVENDRLVAVPVGRQGYSMERNKDGSWSEPQEFVETAYDYSLVQDESGQIHFVSTDDRKLFYRQRDPSGLWSTPEHPASELEQPVVVKLFIGRNNRLGLLVYARDTTGATHGQWHLLLRTPSGWSEPEAFAILPASHGPTSTTYGAFLAGGAIQAIWFERDRNDNLMLLARERFPNGEWGDAELLSYVPYQSKLYEPLLDEKGRIHLYWRREPGVFTNDIRKIFYRQYTAGAWQPMELVIENELPRLLEPSTLSEYGEPRLFVIGRSGDLLRIDREASGWAEPVIVDSPPQDAETVVDGLIRVDTRGQTHVIYYYSSASLSHYLLRYQVVRPDGTVAGPGMTIDSEGGLEGLWWAAVLDGRDRLHIASIRYKSSGGQHIWYAGPAHIAQPGDATVTQSVNIPADMTNPVLSFLYKSSDDNAFEVEAGGTLRDLPAAAFDMAHHWLDMSPTPGRRSASPSGCGRRPTGRRPGPCSMTCRLARPIRMSL